MSDEKKAAEETLDNSKKIRFGIRLKLSVSIIGLVSLIITTIAVFIVYRETELLTDQVFNFAKREIVHLANTAQQTIGFDELTLSDTVDELKKTEFFKYAFVLNRNNEIIYYFDKRGKDGETKHQERKKIDDGVSRELVNRKNPGDIDIIDYRDGDGEGTIYDFSKFVLNRVDNKTKAGTVIIGMSDDEIRKEIGKVKSLISFFFMGFLLISMFGAVILATVIIRPIKILSKGAALIGSGNFSHRIDVDTSDELGRLADEFNQMTEMIQDAKDKEIESRIMNEQLEMARDIQEGLNPMGYYDKNGIQIKGFTRAAKGVGGDYFDYLDIDENRVCALISDVSGKGVPASLVMVMIRTVFTSYISRKDIDCARVVTAINDSLSADFAIDKFATLFFMIYDRKKEELSFSNAGHGPLLCYRASRGVCTETSLDGVPIGIMEDVEYNQAKVKLHPGDLVVLYTDGITEMRNSKKEEYGLEKVQKMMLEKNHLNASEFADLLVADVEEFRGETPPHDDTTTLIFKRDK